MPINALISIDFIWNSNFSFFRKFIAIPFLSFTTTAAHRYHFVVINHSLHPVSPVGRYFVWWLVAFHAEGDISILIYGLAAPSMETGINGNRSIYGIQVAVLYPKRSLHFQLIHIGSFIYSTSDYRYKSFCNIISLRKQYLSLLSHCKDC